MEESEVATERRAGRTAPRLREAAATMVVLNNANIAGSMLAGYFAQDYFERAMGMGPGPRTAMTIFTIGADARDHHRRRDHPEDDRRAPQRRSSAEVRGISGLVLPVGPVAGGVVANIAQRPFQRVGPHPTTEEDIAQLASIGQEQGAIEEHEGDMIHRVLQLNDTTAEQIMTPRIEMIGLAANQTLDQAAEQLAQINRSLIPCYGKNRDEVVVILDRMDALLALAKDRGKIRLTDESISFKPFYVPKSMTADELLVKFQRRTEHMAIVVGEYGETAGLVTIEDVLEEIVGEIYDEEGHRHRQRHPARAADELM